MNSHGKPQVAVSRGIAMNAVGPNHRAGRTILLDDCSRLAVVAGEIRDCAGPRIARRVRVSRAKNRESLTATRGNQSLAARNYLIENVEVGLADCKDRGAGVYHNRSAIVGGEVRTAKVAA